MFFNKKKKNIYYAFMTGSVRPLEEVNDPVFSKKMMGDGYAIEPTAAEIYAPCDGELMTVFPTGHAYGLKQKDGTEILIHLGIDTVELKGQGFESFVKEGQKVKAGDLLGKMDLAIIQAAGKPITSMLVFTSGQKVKLLKTGNVTAKEADMIQVEM